MSSSQSLVRNRKPQILPATQGPMQTIIAPRETSPSPSFRERQRAIKAHSMPIVPSLGQILSGTTQQNISQPSPTGSTGSLPSRRSPPAASRISPAAAKLSNTSHMAQRGEQTPERVSSPPPLQHAQTSPAVPQLINTSLQSQSGVPAHQPRPVPRQGPPQFLSQQYQTTMDDKWQITEDLMREFERGDEMEHGQLNGTSGMAYAGGAASSSSLHLQHTAVERVRAADRASPKDSDNPAKRQVLQKEAQNVRESPKARERSATMSSAISQHTDPQSLARRTPEYRGSPPFHTPMASPGERSAAYTQYVPDSYPSSQATTQAQATSRKPVPVASEPIVMRSTPPMTTKLAAQPQSGGPRVPDRALPLQEEPEEDAGQDFTEQETEYEDPRHSSPKSGVDVYSEGHGSRYEARRDHGQGAPHTDDDDDDDETLNEEVQDHLQQSKSESEDSGFTPRSPSTSLPERPRDDRYSPTSNSQYSTATSQLTQLSAENQTTVRARHRIGSTDQLGMRTFDPTLFEQTMSINRANGQDQSVNGQRPTPTTAHSLQYPHTARPFISGAYGQNSQSLPPMSPHFEDLKGVFDNPTSTYLQSFLQSPAPTPAGGGRPGAPVPPTPMTHTAAPSPSPLSAMPSDIEPRQIGSPYPYPFTHIRRTTLSAAQNAPSSTYDPNSPAAVREQLAMQMHMYALNNGLAPPSDTTFSPSATPFPGAGYNPWAFLYQTARQGDSAMSMRSSPSHEPVSLPRPPLRGRNLRRKENAVNLRVPAGRRRVKPPPRVESTQPRDTSPEPSSGEETAGEEHFVDRFPQNGVNGVKVNGHKQNGITAEEQEDDEDEDWCDEDDDEEDLLHLEYHPSFISRPNKRRRRWDSRLEALTQAFQALDRETDTTLVLLAAPSHTDSLFALTSRSIRRDTSLYNSNALKDLRSNFKTLAGQRRDTRTPTISIIDRLSQSGSSIDGSQAGGEGREEELKRALEAALGSISAMGTIYEEREARWRDELRRLSEDRAHVENLLRHTLGSPLPPPQPVTEQTLLG